MNEQPLNLRASVQEIWRRRVLILIVAGLCGLGGLVYGLVKPANGTAVALVLLPQSSSSTSSATAGNSGNSGVGNAISTDAVIARSVPVLAAAGAKVSPPLGALKVKRLVTVTPLSGQILQIQAQAPASSYAVQLANAVAASYIAYISQLQAGSAQAAVTALQHEASVLKGQINDLQTQINTVTARISTDGGSSSSGQTDTNLLNSLRNEQNQVSLQLNSITNQITNNQLQNGSTASTTRVLQKATAQPASKYRLPIEAAVTAFMIGLLGSATYVLVRSQRGHRLRLRDEIARAAGAPVIASLDAPNCTTPSAWRDLLDAEPRAHTEWALRHVLQAVATDRRPRPALRVISFAGDTPALTTGPRLALHAAASGWRTVFASGTPQQSEDDSVVPLRAAFTGAEPVGRGLPFALGLDKHDDETPGLLVTVVVFDDTAAFTPCDATSLLSISPNFATVDELAHLALHAADSGSPLEGVVVVNPDPRDNTTGLANDYTIRRLPSRVPDAVGESPVHFGALSNNENILAGRLSRGDT